MKKKIVCMLVMTLLIVTGIFPVVNSVNDVKENVKKYELLTNTDGHCYLAAIPDDCPSCMVSYWKLEDTGNWMAEDYIGSNDGGVFTDGDQNEPSWGIGQVGDALWLPGDSDDAGVSINHDSSLNLGACSDIGGGFAFEAWINYKGPTDGTVEFPCIMSKRGSGSNPTTGFMLGIIYHHPSGPTYDGTLMLRIADINYYPCQTKVDDGDWHHIAVFRYNNEVNFYVDGILDGQTTSTKNPDSTGEMRLGIDPKSSHPTVWEGALDEVAIYKWDSYYDQCFNEELILCHYKCGLNGHDYCGCIEPMVEKNVWNEDTNQWVNHILVAPGTTVRFKLSFTNIGDCGQANKVLVEDLLPDGFDYIPNSATPPPTWTSPSPSGYWLAWDSDASAFINGPFGPGQGFDIEFEAEALLPGPEPTITHENCVQFMVYGCGSNFFRTDCVTVEVSLYRPDLHCMGTLIWSDVTAGDTVSSMLEISNVGDNESNLNWQVAEYPSWGKWSFDPSEGQNLAPEDGPVQVEVEVEAPDEKEKEFTGEVKIINVDDPEDYEIIPVSLSTPKNKGIQSLFTSAFYRISRNYPYLFPLLQLLLNLPEIEQ